MLTIKILFNFKTTQIYQHPSLINPIRVYITDIIYLSDLDSDVINIKIFAVNNS